MLLALGSPLATRLLQSFEPEDVKLIMSAASALGTINQDELEEITESFSSQFAHTLGINTRYDHVRSLMEEAFPPERLESILGEPMVQPIEPVWTQFTAGAENTLVPYLLDEHPQTVAYIIANLASEFAATCLSRLPQAMRIAVAQRLINLRPVTSEISSILQDCLRQDVLASTVSNDKSKSLSRFAEIVNNLEPEQSGDLLNSITFSKPDQLQELKGLLFSFADIEFMDAASRAVLLDKVDSGLLTIALSGLSSEFTQLLLSGLGTRTRRMVEMELTSGRPAKQSEIMQARRKIAGLAMELAKRGELSLTRESDQASSR